MALNTLNLKNARATAKPVTNGVGNINAITRSLQDIGKGLDAYYKQQAIEQDKALEKDQANDILAVNLAIHNGEDLNSLDLKTEKGVDFRDEKYTSKLANDNLQETYIQAANEGKTLAEAKVIAKTKADEDIMNIGSPEQKNLLLQKSNANTNEISNNAFQQELARAKSDREQFDLHAAQIAFMNGNPASLENETQRNAYSSLLARNDIGVALNDLSVKAAQNNWNGETQVEYLKNNIASLVAKHPNDMRYVNSLYKAMNESVTQIQSNAANKSIARAEETNQNFQQSMVRSFVTTSGDLSGDINNGLNIGKISVANAKAALHAEMNAAIMEGKVIDENIINFLKEDRPDGRRGWFYTDSSFANKIIKHNNNLKAAGKIERSSKEIAEYEEMLKARLASKSLSSEDIDQAEKEGYLTKGKATTYHGKVIEQNKVLTDTSFVTGIINNPNLTENQKFEVVTDYLTANGRNTEEYKQEMSDSFYQSFVNGNFPDGNVSEEQAVELYFKSEEASFQAMNATGKAPTSIRKMFETANPSNKDQFLRTLTMFSKIKYDTENGLPNVQGDFRLRAAMDSKTYDMLDKYSTFMKEHPETEYEKVVELIQKGLSSPVVKYSDKVFTETRDDFNNIVETKISDFIEGGWFGIGGNDIYENHETSMRKHVIKEAGYQKKVKEYLSDEEAIEIAINDYKNNFLPIGDTLVRLSTTMSESERNTYANEDAIESFKKALAIQYTNDEDEWENIVITPSVDNTQSGLYDVKIKRGAGAYVQAGKVTMLDDNGQAGYMNFKRFIDNKNNFAYEYEAVAKGLTNKNSGYHSYSDYFNESGSKELHANLGAVKSKQQALESRVTLDKTAEQFAVRGVRPEMTKAEQKQGAYNINGKKVKYDDLTIEQSKEIWTKKIKSEKQSFTTSADLKDDFNNLPPKIQNRVIQRSLYTDMSKRQALDAEMKMREDLAKQIIKEKKERKDANFLERTWIEITKFVGMDFLENKERQYNGD